MPTGWLDPLTELLDLVLPRPCVGCGRADGPLCPRCVPAGLLWADGDPPVVAGGSYVGALRAALLRYKERGRRDLAGVLGDRLAAAVTVCRPAGPGCALVPVPSSAAARRARDGDHVLRLARVAGRRCGLPVVTPLRLARPVADSAGLDASARAGNLAGAMTARGAPRPARAVVLVDDIATTGSTLREATRALRAAGWAISGAAVVAATLRRSTAPPEASPSGGTPHAGLAWVDLTE